MDTMRQDFPFLINNANTVYFDNAATTLKPQIVIDRVVNYYTNISANIHRGDYTQALEASKLYDDVRKKVQTFISANKQEEIIFTSGTSDALNRIAFGYFKNHLKEGDVILLNYGEHASNILPWFEVAKSVGAHIEYIPLTAKLMLDLDTLEKTMNPRVKVIACAHISNVLGQVNDVKRITELAHENNSLVVIDGAQAAGHIPTDVQDLDVDFYAFSAHKMMGPSGVGVLYGKMEHLKKMMPLSYGGDSNARFYEDMSVILKDIPSRFETGTPNIEGVIGFGAALDYLSQHDLKKLHDHVIRLHTLLLTGLQELEHVKIHNENASNGILTFTIDGIFSQDVAAYLGHYEICVRAGTHCSKLTPLVLNTEHTVRVSLYFYNCEQDVVRFLEVIKSISLQRVIDLYV